MKGVLLPLVLCLLALTGCDPTHQRQDYRVVRTLPHDSLAYTQGLVLHDGFLWESTGRYGSSSLRKVRPESGEVVLIRELPEEYFGEGLAYVDSVLIQLTWKSGVAFVYDADSLFLKGTMEYSGEGWGLCYDGESLFMSDGSDHLFRRDPHTFEVLGQLQVTRDGLSVWRLNELECVGDDIYSNVYQTNKIVRIDKATGRVLSELDGFSLSVASRRGGDPDAVFNGIAYDSASGAFYVTGKLWPHLFAIEIRED